MLTSLRELGSRYYNIPPYNDEPKLFHVASILPGELEKQGLGRASGSSLLKGRAVAKAVGETVERLSALPPDLDRLPLAALRDAPKPAMDPSSIPFGCRERAPSDSDVVRWVQGYSIQGRQLVETWIPAQLVYLPYQCADWEPLWFVPTSNGLGAGLTREQALVSSILEILERDALMRFWSKPETGQIFSHESLSLPNELATLIETTMRYEFTVKFVALRTAGAAAHTVLAVLIDRTGNWPEYSCGLKSGLDLHWSMLGALEEAHQLRPWLREVVEAAEEVPDLIRTIDDRAIWWVSPEGRGEMARTLETSSTAAAAADFSCASSLAGIVDRLDRDGHRVVFVDLVSAVPGYHVTRAIVPTIAPVCFDELYQVEPTNGDAFAISVRHPLL